MRNVLLSTVLFMGIISVHAQNKVSINNQNMEKKTSAVRLIYPQWQGGIVAHWMPDIPAEDASRGYYLGAQLLNMLAPESSQEVIEVPVSDGKRDQFAAGHLETNEGGPRKAA